MQGEDQSAVIAFLSRGESYGLPATEVTRIATHLSEIFLVADRAFKLKRSIKLPYVDFSTRQMRAAACRHEVELNRRMAAALYLGVRSIRRLDGKVQFGAEGELLDTVVEMRRFDDALLLDRMAERGQLTPALVEATARAIADAHGSSKIAGGGSGAGRVAKIIDMNEASFAGLTLFQPEHVAALHARLRQALARHAAGLDARQHAGKVRHCHGDLHLRNICVIDGKPTPFDCLEFNDELATIDIGYDLAFLLMDLWHGGHATLANIAMNRYVDTTDDADVLPLLGFFMAMRATVRAHVSARQAELLGEDPALRAAATGYLALAKRLLAAGATSLTAIGGLSGSGKSSVVEAIAASLGSPPGARVLESDRLRKASFNVPVDTRLPATAYAPAVSREVYRRMNEAAEQVLRSGYSVVACAVFDRREDRDRIRAAATASTTPFCGIWLTATEATLRQRVAGRQGGPSDADVSVLSMQLARREPLPAEWHIVDAGQSLPSVVDVVRALAGPNRGTAQEPA